MLDCLVERERLYDHIARVLHDDLGQSLLVLTFHLHWVSRHCGDVQPIRDKLDRMHDIIGYTNRTLRHLARDCRPLRPDVETPLPAIIDTLVQQFECESGVTCRLEVADPLPSLARAYVIAVARIVHGLLIALHDDRRIATLTLRLHGREDRVRIAVDRGTADDSVRETEAGDRMTIPAQVETLVNALGGQHRHYRHDDGGDRVEITVPVASSDDI